MTYIKKNDKVSYDTRDEGDDFLGALIADINKILADMRNAIDNHKYIPVFRKKNLDTLAILGITWSDALEEIYSLTSSDYDSGPEIDRDRPLSDSLWVFKKNVYGSLIYIKFKIEYQENGDIKILSFHIDNI